MLNDALNPKIKNSSRADVKSYLQFFECYLNDSLLSLDKEVIEFARHVVLSGGKRSAHYFVITAVPKIHPGLMIC